MKKNELDKQLLQLYNNYGKLTKSIILSNNKKLYGELLSQYGGIQKFNEMHELIINKPRNVSKEYLKKELYRIFEIAKNENKLITKQFWINNSYIGVKSIYRLYGSFGNFIKSFNDINDYNNQFIPTKKEITDEIIKIHDLSKKLNEKFNIRFYKKHSKNLWYLCKYYGSYQNAVFELNLSSNIIKDPTKDEYKNEIEYLYNKYGYISIELLANKSKYKCKGIRLMYDKFGGYNNILKELNIPTKYSKNKSCMLLLNIISEILGYEPYYEYTWDFLKNPITGYNLRVDAYFKNDNLVVEYNGRQHYEWIKKFHKTKEEYVNYCNNYNFKIKKLSKLNFKIFEFKYNEKLDNEYIENKLNKILNK